MRALALNAWRIRRHPSDVMAVALGGAYVVIIVSGVVGGPQLSISLYLLPLPLLLPPVLFLRRQPLSAAQSAAAGAAGTTLAAFIGAAIIVSAPTVAVAVPIVVISAMAAARRPAAALTVCLLCTGAFGSLQALASVPAAKVADLALLGLWLAAIWGWWFGGHLRSRFLPALAVLILYLLFSAGEIFTAETSTIGFQAFRGTMWYLAVLVLAANAPWPAESRDRMLKAVAVVGLLIGGYATLRWAIGPAGAERTLAETNPNNLLDGELRPIGSFSTSKELACWTAIVLPFLFGLGLTWRGRWRLVALAATAATAVGMLAADVRAGPAAAVPGLVIVLLLYQLSQAFRGRRGPLVLVLVLLAVLGSGGAFALTLGGKDDTTERYDNILHPERDSSFQARLVKWRAALDDIEKAPLGHGLGTAGRTQKRYGTTANIGSNDVDNSYLTLAYEQGFVVMILLVSILALLLATLARGAVAQPDPARAGPLICACGTFVSMLVIFYVGDYVEGLQALGGWLLVGLGLGQLTRTGQSSAV